MHTHRISSLLLIVAGAAVLGPACVADGDASPEDEHPAEAEQDLSTITIGYNESPAWPKTVSACVDSNHVSHSPFYWSTSHSRCASGYCAQMCNLTAETCNISATVATDGQGHTSPTKKYDLIDVRDGFFVSNDLVVPVGGSAVLTVPAPHAGHHCDQAGTFYWEVYNESLGQWFKVPGTDDQAQLGASLPAGSPPGDETYRVRCSHAHPSDPDGVHYSDPVTVTWVSGPACSVDCWEDWYPNFICEVSVSGGVGPFTYFRQYDGDGWYAMNGATYYPKCKYKLGLSYDLSFKAVDALGNACTPVTWRCE